MAMNTVGTLRGMSAPNYLRSARGVSFGVIGGVEHAFVAGFDDDAFVVVDVSTPSGPTLTATLRGSGSPNYLNGPWATDFCVIGGVEHVLVASQSDNSFVVVDVSTPSSPTVVGTLRGSGSPNYLNQPKGVAFGFIGGVEHAVVSGNMDNALVVVDISTPSSPTLTDTLRGSGSPNYLAWNNGVGFGVIGGVEHAFVVGYNDDSLVVVDVSTPSNVTLAGTLRGPGAPNYLDAPYDVAFGVVGGVEHAFVVSGSDSALTVVDVSTPSSPTLAGVFRGPGAPKYMSMPTTVEFGLVGGVEHALVTSWGDDGVVLVDVSTPSNPTLAGVLEGEGAPEYLASAKGGAFAAIGGVEHLVVSASGDNALVVVGDLPGAGGGGSTVQPVSLAGVQRAGMMMLR